MLMETNTLSDKRINLGWCYAYPQPDVKEFISKLKDRIEKLDYASLNLIREDEVLREINKLAGDKLK